MLTRKHREKENAAKREHGEQEEQKRLQQIEEAKQFVPTIYSKCIEIARAYAETGHNIAGLDIWTSWSPEWCGPGENDYTEGGERGLCTADKNTNRIVADEVVKLLKSQNPGLQTEVTFWGQRYFTSMQITMYW